MSTKAIMLFEIDGFVIYEQETGSPVDLIASTKDGSMRERVERGLVMRVDCDRFYVTDTRWTR